MASHLPSEVRKNICELGTRLKRSSDTQLHVDLFRGNRDAMRFKTSMVTVFLALIVLKEKMGLGNANIRMYK